MATTVTTATMDDYCFTIKLATTARMAKAARTATVEKIPQTCYGGDDDDDDDVFWIEKIRKDGDDGDNG